MQTTTVTDYPAGLDGPRREIGEKREPVIGSALPASAGAMWHGHLEAK